MGLDLKKFINRFIDETHDHIQAMLAGLADLEKNPTTGESLNAVFRSAHTIKGSARMLKLAGITETAHCMEDLLDALRNDSITFSTELFHLLYRGVDAVSTLVDHLAAEGRCPPQDELICNLLSQAASSASQTTTSAAPLATPLAPPSAPPQPPPPASSPQPEKDVDPPLVPPPSSATAKSRLNRAESVRIRVDKLEELVKLMGEVFFSHARLERHWQEIRILTHRARSDEAPSPAVRRDQAEQLHHAVQALGADISKQGLLMTELSQKTLLMRMLPTGLLFESSARLVREVARSLGKEAECTVKGTEIELDRQVIDRLSDPLVHLLRNALDHGIEPPAQRLAAGKPARGRIEISARQEGRSVVVSIQDDGRGLDRKRILAKATQKGILTAEQAAALPDDKLIDLIFLPGFSTSSLITDVSGRGVGMDVVKKTIVDDLQGEITLASQPGSGTTFELRLPLSLAMMRVMLCQVSYYYFGFIAQGVRELIRVTPAEVHYVSGRKTIILDNEFIPIVPLIELLDIPVVRSEELSPDKGWLVVVIRNGQDKLGLQIERLIDEQDMVIKPLPEHMQKLPLISGLVITAANEVVSILHVPSLLAKARTLRNAQMDREMVADHANGHHILVVDDSLSTREIEKDVLEIHGYRVTLAEDGLDGWKKAMAGTFDAILTDVEMPILDGFSLITRLRQEERYQHTPIVIMTSRAQESDKQRGIQVGANAYIVKGDFEQGSLLDTLHNLL
ncbi:two-component system, chemotaxis family, sensor histidine kinase and response regulator WspE [Gammaproteobacteria bacterium]